MCCFTLLTEKSWKEPLLLSLITPDASKGEGKRVIYEPQPKKLIYSTAARTQHLQSFPSPHPEL